MKPTSFRKDSINSIKTLLLIVCIFLFKLSDAQHDHEGHSHSHGEEVTESVDMSDIPLPTSSESISDKYEVLLKFQPVEPGEELTMMLFLSDVNTNAPIDSASVVIQNVQVADQKFEIELEEKGIYHIHTIMGEEKLFDLDVTIQSPKGADLIHEKTPMTANAQNFCQEKFWFFGCDFARNVVLCLVIQGRLAFYAL